MQVFLKRNKSFSDFANMKDRYKQIYITNSKKVAKELNGPVYYILSQPDEPHDFVNKVVYEKCLKY